MKAEMTPLTFQLPWFAYLEKPSNLSSTSGNGQERPNVLSYRFQIIVYQYGCHHKEGLGKRTGGRGKRWEAESFLTGQYVAVWFWVDNIFMNKHLFSNIRLSTILNRVLLTWCFILGWILNSRKPRCGFPHSFFVLLHFKCAVYSIQVITLHFKIQDKITWMGKQFLNSYNSNAFDFLIHVNIYFFLFSKEIRLHFQAKVVNGQELEHWNLFKKYSEGTG